MAGSLHSHLLYIKSLCLARAEVASNVSGWCIAVVNLKGRQLLCRDLYFFPILFNHLISILR